MKKGWEKEEMLVRKCNETPERPNGKSKKIILGGRETRKATKSVQTNFLYREE